MARRHHDLTKDHLNDDYGDYYDEGYGQELDEDELAIRESKKQLKKDKKVQKKL